MITISFHGSMRMQFCDLSWARLVALTSAYTSSMPEALRTKGSFKQGLLHVPLLEPSLNRICSLFGGSLCPGMASPWSLFIYSFSYFYSASSNKLLLRNAPDTARMLGRRGTPQRPLQL